MQQTLPRPAAGSWLQAAFARITASAKRRAPVAAVYGDIKMTDQLEREFAEREFRRWR
jgi:hypothetical protein